MTQPLDPLAGEKCQQTICPSHGAYSLIPIPGQEAWGWDSVPGSKP